MRYFYDEPTIYLSLHGKRYECDHPVYTACTLYLIQDKGLAVIQQRYDPVTKHTWWGEIDPCLRDAIYFHPEFKAVFDERADNRKDGLYPTITIRQLMWRLRMKPLKRERWETCFDRRDI